MHCKEELQQRPLLIVHIRILNKLVVLGRSADHEQSSCAFPCTQQGTCEPAHVSAMGRLWEGVACPDCADIRAAPNQTPSASTGIRTKLSSIFRIAGSFLSGEQPYHSTVIYRQAVTRGCQRPHGSVLASNRIDCEYMVEGGERSRMTFDAALWEVALTELGWEDAARRAA